MTLRPFDKLKAGFACAIVYITNNIAKSFKERIKERIKSKIVAISVENLHFTKFASYTILASIIPLSILSAQADRSESKPENKIAFVKNENILEVKTDQPKITPGESADQKITREAAEKATAEKMAVEKAVAEKTAQSAKKVTGKLVKIYNDPSNFDGLYQSAGAAYGIDWRILKSVHYAETGCSGSTMKRNPSGATGPFQFIPSTWRRWGIDGDGDGKADIGNVTDAAYSAARYLAVSGGPANNYKKSLWSYNPSARYYTKVMSIAKGLGL
ncbi:MAG: membrane-bound lytic murein transglycosylase B-like protein [Candidatus Berkelbacteria bacterium Athens1014_28]|uniref:Membrane-bound lytic murein transglycosylase B-like protein n=1 Tax=Candidatus Berkelbacteria bacterium Athens1014_28 TaxID=2017145 RepID=A0A554LQD9_9BACT|nr:MAG: membrane-bound lytic murein transglycosylase B-like protein [Candidatus Berkelbacteria bacterium Athens1014_28]